MRLNCLGQNLDLKELRSCCVVLSCTASALEMICSLACGAQGQTSHQGVENFRFPVDHSTASTDREASSLHCLEGGFMTDAPRMTVEDLRRRMDSGEEFTIVDTRNPHAWAESDTMI